jgi:hypothetical protein
LVGRFTDSLFAEIESALAATTGSAIERFQCLVAASSQAKLGRREETLTLTRSLYSDENWILRHRLREGWTRRTRPLMLSIVEQGQAEGSFDVPDAAAMTEVWLSLWYDYGMEVARLFFCAQDDPTRVEELFSAMNALAIAQERLLGAKPGVLQMDFEPALRAILAGEE